MAKAFRKHHQRTIDRINLLVRLELANPSMSLAELAQLAGIKQVRFSIIRASALYAQIKNQYQTGLLTRLDHQVQDQFKLTKETLSFAVPIALQNLVKQAMTASDERVKNKACNDILDREGTFAKVARMKLTSSVERSAAEDKDNETARSLQEALKTTTTVPDVAAITDTIQ